MSDNRASIDGWTVRSRSRDHVAIEPPGLGRDIWLRRSGLTVVPPYGESTTTIPLDVLREALRLLDGGEVTRG